MSLSPLQRKTLEQYALFRTSPPTWQSLLTLAAPRWMFRLILTIVGVVVLTSNGSNEILWAFAGFIFGVTTIDLGTMGKSIKVWPIVAEVIDWNRLEQILVSKPGTAPDLPVRNTN